MENSAPGIFDILIWSGAFVSMAGLCGLIWCIVYVAAARRKNLPEDDLRAVMRKALPLNLASLFLSVIGLMMVILGIFLS